jgi:hypothetical protein
MDMFSIKKSLCEKKYLNKKRISKGKGTNRALTYTIKCLPCQHGKEKPIITLKLTRCASKTKIVATFCETDKIYIYILY